MPSDLKPAHIGRYEPVGFFQIPGMPEEYIVDSGGKAIKGPVLTKILQGAHNAGECSCPARQCGWARMKK